MSYERLIDEHDAIDAIANRLVEIVQSDRPAEMAAHGLMADLAISVHDHLRAEDRTVYGPLLALQQQKPLRTEVEFEMLFEELRCDWEVYLSEWTIECIEADWPTFQAETVAIMKRLRERVQIETSLIYPLALQQGTIRLRDAPP